MFEIRYTVTVDKGLISLTKIYAHRGSRGNYPENSMLAFSKAIETGVDGMEFDIHMTKDGELVVIHDTTLDRTTTGTGYIKDYTLAEIRTFSIGAKFTEFKHYDPSWDDEVVPTLTEVLLLCKEYDLKVNIELKTHEVVYPNIEEAMLKVVEAVGYDHKKIVYSAFHLPTILRIKKLRSHALIAWLLEIFIPMPADYISTFGLDALHVDKDIVFKNPAYWQQIADKLRVWTVNKEKDMKKLTRMGVRAIMTDYPEIAMRIRG